MKLITDLEDLLFRTFIKCHVEQQYSCLLLEGEATPDELRHCWENLLSQYHELTGNTDAVHHIKRTAKIEAYTMKVLHVEALCMAVEEAVILPAVLETVVKLLQIWGYKRQFTAETLQNDLKYIRNSNGNDRLKLKRLQIENEEAEEREAKKVKKAGKSDPKKDFMSMLHAVEAHKKMVFDRDKLNMYDFALYINDLRDYNKQMTIKTKRNGSK